MNVKDGNLIINKIDNKIYLVDKTNKHYTYIAEIYLDQDTNKYRKVVNPRFRWSEQNKHQTKEIKKFFRNFSESEVAIFWMNGGLDDVFI